MTSVWLWACPSRRCYCARVVRRWRQYQHPLVSGIDEPIPPVIVHGDGTVSEGTYPQTTQLEGGYSVLELPSYDAALEWAAKIAVACRCAQEVRAFQYDPAS
jgi:hypothetical protein